MFTPARLGLLDRRGVGGCTIQLVAAYWVSRHIKIHLLEGKWVETEPVREEHGPHFSRVVRGFGGAGEGPYANSLESESVNKHQRNTQLLLTYTTLTFPIKGLRDTSFEYGRPTKLHLLHNSQEKQIVLVLQHNSFRFIGRDRCRR